MKTQLIKLRNKFILVSDEEIKDGDLTMVKDGGTLKFNPYPLNNKYNQKIIAGIPKLPLVDFSLLSEEDCKKIGWIDIEKISKNFAIIQTNLGCKNFHDLEFAYKEGFKDAQSLKVRDVEVWDVEVEMEMWNNEGVTSLSKLKPKITSNSIKIIKVL